MRSLQTFMLEFPCTFAVCFWSQPMQKDICIAEERNKEGEVVKRKEYTLFSVPFYFAGYLETFLAKYLIK